MSDPSKTGGQGRAYGGGMAPRFDLIGIVTDNLAASLAFYRRLGLEIPADADDQPHVEIQLPGGLRMAWDTADTIRSFDPTWTPPSGGARFGMAFLCDNPADVDATYADLVAAGYAGHLAPWDAVWGQRYASVHDPDANPIDLFAPLPTTD